MALQDDTGQEKQSADVTSGQREKVSSRSSDILETMLHRKQTTMTANATSRERRFPILAAMLNSPGFDTLMGLAIALNAVTMGIQAEMLIERMSQLETAMFISENVFTAIFVAELASKVFIFGWRRYVPIIGSLWMFLDALLVIVTGVVMVWVWPILQLKSSPIMQSLAILRSMRLVRLVNVVSRMKSFTEAWQMLRGLQESLGTLFWTVLVIFCITYIFAVFGVVLLSVDLQQLHREAIGSVDEESLRDLVYKSNGILPMMYTLIQVLTLDSWTGVSREMQFHIWWSWMYFYFYISVVVVVLLNLVTAVIVDTALRNSKKDDEQLLAEKKEHEKKELAIIKQCFHELDEDGDQEVSYQEFEAAFDDQDHRGIATKLRLLGFNVSECRDLFMLLDTGDGCLSLEEFFEGLKKMQGEAKARDMFKIMKTMADVERMMICYANEMEEDIAAILRGTFGVASLHASREGSLKARSQRRSIGVMRSTPEPSEAPEPEGVFAETFRSVQRLLDGVKCCRSSFHERVLLCDRRTESLCKELGELKVQVAELKLRLDGLRDRPEAPLFPCGAPQRKLS